MITRNNLPIDIETIPAQDESLKQLIADSLEAPANYKDPDKIFDWKRANADKAWRKTSFDGAYGHVAVIGYAWDDGDPVTLYSDDYVKDEPKILREFHKVVNERMAKQPGGAVRVIGHSVREFDLRFIRQRSILLGIQLTPHIRWDAREWDTAYVFDTSFQWAGRDGVKLSKLCDVMGLQGKGEEIGEEIDGSMVWDFVERGEIAKVAAYCAGDVKRTWEIYKRMTSVMGWMVGQEAA